jgi:diacylglycerol kinase (ATP)
LASFGTIGALSAAMIDATLLYNPAAGRTPLPPERLRRLLEKLLSMGIRCEAVMSHPDGSTESPRLDLRNKSLLLVYGGDGTIHQAVQQVAANPVKVALLPAGTANVLARELGVPLDPDRAVDLIAQGKTRRIFLGQSEGRYFHLMAGVGLDAYVINAVGLGLKKRLGIGAYWVAGLLAFRRYPLTEFDIEIDGETHRGTFAVIANARNYGGSLLIAPEADLTEPCLDVCVFGSRRKRRFFRYLFAAFRGSHIRLPDVTYRKATSVRVLGPPLPVQMDGEVVGQTPISLSLYSPGIEVYTP